MFANLQSCENYLESDFYIDSDGNIQYIEDDTPFVMQEPTDKLVVYISPYNGYIYTPALNIFREKYPHVEIEVIEFGRNDADKYFTLLKTELMAGKGPDLILEQPMGGGFLDIYKLMDTGIFVDLQPFIDEDSEFNLDDYNKAVLDAGRYRGKRYLMPIQYDSQILLTTQEILDAEGVKVSDLETFDGFIKAITRYNEKYKNNPGKTVFKKQSYCAVVHNVFPWSGIELINYATRTVNFDTPYFKSIVEAMKWSYVGDEPTDYDRIPRSLSTVPALENQEIFFDLKYGFSYHEFHENYFGLLDKGLTPVFFKYPNIENENNARVDRVIAIPKASKNQINAYNLIKIILSEDIQNDSSIYFPMPPVLKSAAKAQFEEAIHGSGNFQALPPLPEEVFNAYLDLLINVDTCSLITFTPYYEIFRRDMGAYFEGKKSFDECVKILENSLQIYVSE